jgi:hypothetical protein
MRSFIAKYYDDQLKEDEMGRTYSTRGGGRCSDCFDVKI